MAVGRLRRQLGAPWVGLLGMFLAIAGLTVYAVWPQQRMAVSLFVGLALCCFVIVLLVHQRAIRVAAVGRAARRGFHSGVMIVIFVAIVGLVNMLAARHNFRWDLSEAGQFSLAEQTTKLLGTLDRDVHITIFIQDLGRTKAVLQGLVESYQYLTPRLTFTSIDPEKHPAVANQYGVTQYGTVVFESGDQEARVRFFNQEDLNNREQLFTNALIRVTRDEKKQITFLEGHGEHRIDDAGARGFSLLKEALGREGYETTSFSLAQEGVVPDGTTVMVIGGPTRLLPPQEVDALLAYLNGGGRLFVMVDPLVESGLAPLLDHWGVSLDNDLVIDTSISLFGAGLEVVVATNYSSSHQITKDFTLSTAFPMARSVRFLSAKQGQMLFEGLVMTSDRSWGETDLTGGPVSLDRLRDIKGPLLIGAAVSPAPISDTLQTGATEVAPNIDGRLVVFGDSDFARNDSFRLMGNGDLFLNSVSWLAEEEETISIRPKEARMSPLILDSNQERSLFLVAVVLLPGTVLVVGFGVWQWRRRL